MPDGEDTAMKQKQRTHEMSPQGTMTLKGPSLSESCHDLLASLLSKREKFNL